MQQLCPAGWKLPSRDDFNSLALQLGGLSEAGGKMKESGPPTGQLPIQTPPTQVASMPCPEGQGSLTTGTSGLGETGAPSGQKQRTPLPMPGTTFSALVQEH